MKARVILPKNQQKAMDEEINRQLSEAVLKEERDIQALVLYILHSQFGWGKVRLERFMSAYHLGLKELSDWYDMEGVDQTFLATRKIKELGIDVEDHIRDIDTSLYEEKTKT